MPGACTAALEEYDNGSTEPAARQVICFTVPTFQTQANVGWDKMLTGSIPDLAWEGYMITYGNIPDSD